MADVSLDELRDVRARGRRLRRASGGGGPGGDQRRSTPTVRRPGHPRQATGVTGEVLVAAAHVKERYDALWLTQHESARDAGWHRTGDVGHLDGDGRLWIEGRLAHVLVTADGVRHPGRARAAGAARRRRGRGGRRRRRPAGAPSRSSSSCSRRCSRTDRVVAEPDAGRGGARRAGAGTDVAAVLVVDAAADRRPAQLQDRPVAGRGVGGARAVGGAGPAVTRVLVTGASGMLGRGGRRAPRRGRPRRPHAPAQRLGRRAVPRTCAGSVTDVDVVARRRPRPRGGRAPGGEGVDHRAVRRVRGGQRRGDPAPARRGAVGGGRPVRARLVAVGRAPRPLAGRCGRRSGRPRARPRQLRPHQGGGRAARARGARPRRSGASSWSGRTWSGDRETRSWSGGSSTAPAPGGCRCSGRGAALIDTTYVDNAVDALVAALDADPSAYGAPYVVTNGEPRPVVELLAGICAASGRPRAAGGTSRALARARCGVGPRRRPGALPAAGGAAADPVRRRAAVDRALVRPAPHARRARLGAPRDARRGSGAPGRGGRRTRRPRRAP